MKARISPGSARVSRVWRWHSAIANFSWDNNDTTLAEREEDRFGETPKPTREMRALPNLRDHACER
jgi:hypothetical protein